MLWVVMVRGSEDDVYMISLRYLRRIRTFMRNGFRIERLRWYVIPKGLRQP